MVLRKIITFCGIGALLFSVTMSSPVYALSNYAALAVDITNNEVILAHNPQKTVYPASITKLMALYLVFEALQDGRISLNDMVNISQKASIQPRVKAYLVPGSKVSVRNLILMMAVSSFNDANYAIAEELAGNADDFVEMMNKKAKELGLIGTHYTMVHGCISDPNHYTTPQDTINIARRLQQDFPQYMKIFSISHYVYNGKSYPSTNNVMRYFKHIDGLKTGYTDISGFNLMASLRYKDTSIFVVIFGFAASKDRDEYMVRILDYVTRKSLDRQMVKSTAIGIISKYDEFIASKDIVTTFGNSLFYDLRSIATNMRYFNSKYIINVAVDNLLQNKDDWSLGSSYPMPYHVFLPAISRKYQTQALSTSTPFTRNNEISATKSRISNRAGAPIIQIEDAAD